MSPLKASLLAAVISAGLTAGCLFFVQHRRAQEFASLRNANNRMRLQASQRAAASRLAPNAATEPVSDTPASLQTSTPAPDPKSSGDYRNEGVATPLATLQTFAWACDRGDTVTVTRLLCFDAAARTKAEAFMATVPADARARWNSPEEMAAVLLTAANMNAPFPSARFLEKAAVAPNGEGRVMLRLPGLTGTPKDCTEYQKTNEGWKYVITEAAVDNYISRASARPPTSR